LFRPDAQYGAVDVVKKEAHVATTFSTPPINFASGDYNVSPGLVQEEKMFFPSPKNVTRPSVTRAPVAPVKSCPRSNFPDIHESTVSMSRSIPKPHDIRIRSEAEGYSQSLDTPGFHGSNSVAVGMSQLSSYLNTPRSAQHRCSLPSNQRNIYHSNEDITRKAIKQTNV